MATQPTNDLLVWANTDVNLPNLAGPNKTEPSVDLVAKGWDFKQKPSASEFNYILNNYSEWIGYLKSYIDEIVIGGATGDAANAGSVIYFARESAPVGYLKANGAAVDNTVYMNLDTAIYVGDTLNSTALFGYRCTDPQNPSTTRSITGTYIVLPDLRGEFIRSWDDSKGVDSGRSFGTWQKGTLVGGYDDNNRDSDVGFLPSRITRDYGSDTVDASLYGLTEVVFTSGSTRVSYVTASAEQWYAVTRPRNISLLACIKY